jgi:hypothetical protein
MNPTTKRRTKWALAPVLAFGLLAGGAAIANAATSIDTGPIPTIAQSTSGRISGVTWNTAGTPMTSTLDVIWQAPPNSVFANNQLGWETVTGGAPFPGNPTFNSSGCVLSNGNTTLTCTGQSFTVPAAATDANGTLYSGYGQMWANITVDSGAPYAQEFRGGLSWTSNNGQITTALPGPAGMTPGFKTPLQPPFPLVDPLVGVSVGALVLGTGAALALTRRRRAGAQN